MLVLTAESFCQVKCQVPRCPGTMTMAHQRMPERLQGIPLCLYNCLAQLVMNGTWIVPRSHLGVDLYDGHEATDVVTELEVCLIQEAYGILNDPEKKRQYDLSDTSPSGNPFQACDPWHMIPLLKRAESLSDEPYLFTSSCSDNSFRLSWLMNLFDVMSWVLWKPINTCLSTKLSCNTWLVASQKPVLPWRPTANAIDRSLPGTILSELWFLALRS